MSRLGKKPVALPKGCTATFENGVLSVKGSLGQMQMTIPELAQITLGDASVSVDVDRTFPEWRARLGLYRALINNMVSGVSAGFSRELEIIGVGYRAALDGNTLTLSMGYSHPVHLTVPQGLKVELAKPTSVKISGIDKALLGAFCSTVKRVRPVEPYKGKGIREAGQRVILKEGKKK